MCTAVRYLNHDCYFGRTLDIGKPYAEEVVITPRRYPFYFRKAGELTKHYAMIGMAFVCEGYPLYYDAVNEKGLAMAGLNFVGNAAFYKEDPKKDNLSQFELIPWILAQCATVKEARALLNRCNLVKIPFNEQLPVAELHWMVCDKTGAIAVECTAEGFKRSNGHKNLKLRIKAV